MTFGKGACCCWCLYSCCLCLCYFISSLIQKGTLCFGVTPDASHANANAVVNSLSSQHIHKDLLLSYNKSITQDLPQSFFLPTWSECKAMVTFLNLHESFRQQLHNISTTWIITGREKKESRQGSYIPNPTSPSPSASILPPA